MAAPVILKASEEGLDPLSRADNTPRLIDMRDRARDAGPADAGLILLDLPGSYRLKTAEDPRWILDSESVAVESFHEQACELLVSFPMEMEQAVLEQQKGPKPVGPAGIGPRRLMITGLGRRAGEALLRGQGVRYGNQGGAVRTIVRSFHQSAVFRKDHERIRECGFFGDFGMWWDNRDSNGDVKVWRTDVSGCGVAGVGIAPGGMLGGSQWLECQMAPNRIVFAKYGKGGSADPEAPDFWRDQGIPSSLLRGCSHEGFGALFWAEISEIGGTVNCSSVTYDRCFSSSGYLHAGTFPEGLAAAFVGGRFNGLTFAHGNMQPLVPPPAAALRKPTKAMLIHTPGEVSELKLGDVRGLVEWAQSRGVPLVRCDGPGPVRQNEARYGGAPATIRRTRAPFPRFSAVEYFDAEQVRPADDSAPFCGVAVEAAPDSRSTPVIVTSTEPAGLPVPVRVDPDGKDDFTGPFEYVAASRDGMVRRTDDRSRAFGWTVGKPSGDLLVPCRMR